MTPIYGPMSVSPAKKTMLTLLDLCVSSLRRGHANLLCIVPILTDDPRRESSARLLRSTWRRARAATAAARKTERILHDPMYVNICIGGRFVRARSGWPAGRCAPIPFPHPSPPLAPSPPRPLLPPRAVVSPPGVPLGGMGRPSGPGGTISLRPRAMLQSWEGNTLCNDR